MKVQNNLTFIIIIILKTDKNVDENKKTITKILIRKNLHSCYDCPSFSSFLE